MDEEPGKKKRGLCAHFDHSDYSMIEVYTLDYADAQRYKCGSTAMAGLAFEWSIEFSRPLLPCLYKSKPVAGELDVTLSRRAKKLATKNVVMRREALIRVCNALESPKYVPEVCVFFKRLV